MLRHPPRSTRTATLFPSTTLCRSGDHAVRLQRPADLGAADRARWADLSDRAGTANVFAQHWFMDPALRHAGADQPIWLAIVERDGDEWIGVLPLVHSARFGRGPRSEERRVGEEGDSTCRTRGPP